MDEMQPIEALIDSDTRLAVVETSEHNRIIEWLRKLFSTTGRASYVWTAQHGLQRIAIEHILIPNTLRPLDVLDHILTSHHFGIYLLRDFQAALSDPMVCARLERQMDDTGSAHKLVLLLGAHHKLPTRLATRVEQITLI
jgi:hypothetical protein